MLDDVMGSATGSLARYTRDLTAEARAARLDPVRCRDDEIGRVVDILLRHGKNNPALVGPAGVGKTAIAEGLAQRVAEGRVPLTLRAVRILALDHMGLLAGTMFRGQYEDRLRAIVSAASADPNIILFIDELHNLIGQGTAMGVAMDAANMLKPALVRGEFRVIGATTQDEYEHWVRGDPALERRFQRVVVRELGSDETLEILRARQDRLERHHNVAIAEDALVASVALTDRYITDRARPDRAIDALDEACAHAQAVATYPAELESLIVQRRDLVRRVERVVVREPEREVERPPAAEGSPAEMDDPLERMAREGLSVLERFGAGLEAALLGPRTPADAAPEPASPAGAPPHPPHPAPADSTGLRARLAVLEAELRNRLIDAGLIVRGHDVARVVALASGHDVQWSLST